MGKDVRIQDSLSMYAQKAAHMAVFAVITEETQREPGVAHAQVAQAFPPTSNRLAMSMTAQKTVIAHPARPTDRARHRSRSRPQIQTQCNKRHTDPLAPP